MSEYTDSDYVFDELADEIFPSLQDMYDDEQLEVNNKLCEYLQDEHGMTFDYASKFLDSFLETEKSKG